MHHKLCDKLYLDANGGTEYSQAVATEGFNAVDIECTAFSGGPIEMYVQQSNDLENWVDAGAVPTADATTSAAPTYMRSGPVTVSARQVRIKWVNTHATEAAIISGGVNLSSQ